MKNPYRKSNRVRLTGVGRTGTWKDWQYYVGTVTSVFDYSVGVVWDGLHFEDEMQLDEIKREEME